MFNRFARTTSVNFNRQSPSTDSVRIIPVNGWAIAAQRLLMSLGILAICALALMFVKPEMTEHLKDLSPFAQAEEDNADADLPPLADLMNTQEAAAGSAAAMSVEETRLIATSREQQWVTNWISKRYRVATDATNMLVSAAYLTAKELKLDPLLILSVMAIESRFNPFAESPVGAQGLMQVMSKVHRDKFEDQGGMKAALNPVANIRVGSLILKDYVTRGGSVEAGLKLYVGAGAMESDYGYGARVLAEYNRLKDVAMGKKVPIYATSASAVVPKPAVTGTKVNEPLKRADEQPLAQAAHAPAL